MNKLSEKGIDKVYRMYAHDLFSYALGLGFDRDTSMDAIHDVFYKICLDDKVMDKVNNMRFYLLRSLKNRLLDIHKQKRGMMELPLGGETSDDLPFTVQVSVEDVLIQAEEDENICKQVEQLLQSLTDRQREIIYLRYSMGCDYEEIAQLMQITVPACRKLSHKAVSKLRKSPYYIFLLLLFS